MQETEQLLPRFDPFQAARSGNPYLDFARARAAGPLLRGGPGIWIVPRYREVVQLLHDWRLRPFQFGMDDGDASTTVTSPLGDGQASSFLRNIVVASSGADHIRMRKAVANVFRAAEMENLRGLIETATRELLAPAIEAGRIEIVSELAYRLALRVACTLAGVPASDVNSVGARVLTLSRVFAPMVAEADRITADQAVIWLRDYIGSLFETRSPYPGNDAVSVMAALCRGGGLSREEAIDNTIFLLYAGMETSMNLIAGGSAALSEHPGEMAKLRDDPGRVPFAIEEFLRYETPTQLTGRIVIEPIEIAGRTLRKGRIVLLLLGSANHDEDQFEEPERLNTGRDPNPHLSFGAGPHYCVGARVARLESGIVFRILSQRFRTFEPAGPILRQPTATPRIYTSVPLRLALN